MAKSSPYPLDIKVYGGWALCCFLLLTVVPVLLDATHPGGEAKGLTFASTVIGYALCGFSALSCFFLTQRRKWTPPYLLRQVLVLGCSLYPLLSFWYESHHRPPQYDFSSDLTITGVDTLETQLEYYSMNPDTLRSRTVFHRHQSDTVRTIYDRKGHIISANRP
ncbi:hypothetical protein [Hymenobacter sp. HDW8]|uniref:hypothetical protein n=1 Tax=Hymenobacter sp. HDW8 TaxID=2714932 RepID=UPI0014089AEB|nr:hypothetical protein [Hymenobacter sp. HDW8]QIL78372.1 hypothetical protein G7064_21390 [Hymenobacter sp. HDW8]